jgi:hypothetical protein
MTITVSIWITGRCKPTNKNNYNARFWIIVSNVKLMIHGKSYDNIGLDLENPQ